MITPRARTSLGFAGSRRLAKLGLPPHWPSRILPARGPLRRKIALTTGYVDSKPGSLQGIQLNVDDVDSAHAYLRDRGTDLSEIQTYPWGRFFFFFKDLDGNGWSVHESVQ